MIVYHVYLPFIIRLYNTLLIPVILERLPDSVKFVITRKLGKNNWKILELVESIKKEVDARKKTEFSNEKSDVEYCRKITHSLVGFQKPSSRNCVFCGKCHYGDKCQNITDIAKRKKILRKEKHCFNFLFNGHVIKNCRANYKCFNCQGTGDIVDGLVKRGNGVAPVALGSKLGWLLGGPVAKQSIKIDNSCCK